MIRSRSGNYDSLTSWFTNVHKNPLARDDARSTYLRQFIPGVADYDRASYNWDQANKYLDRYGLAWDDIDPMRMADKFNLSGYTRSTLTLSKNIMRLYR